MKTQLGLSRPVRGGVALVGAVALLLTASACSSDPEQASDDTQTSQAPEPSESTTVEPFVESVQSVIVKFAPGETPGDARPDRRAFFADTLTNHGVQAKKISLSLTDTWVIDLNKEVSGEDLQDLLGELSELPGVEYAQPNSMATAN